MAMTKTANKSAIKALPALRASIIWFKRETVRALERSAADATSPMMRATYAQKARKVAATDLADLRNAYQCARVSEIRSAPRFELTRVIPTITWMEV